MPENSTSTISQTQCVHRDRMLQSAEDEKPNQTLIILNFI